MHGSGQVVQYIEEYDAVQTLFLERKGMGIQNGIQPRSIEDI